MWGRSEDNLMGNGRILEFGIFSLGDNTWEIPIPDLGPILDRWHELFDWGTLQSYGLWIRNEAPGYITSGHLGISLWGQCDGHGR